MEFDWKGLVRTVAPGIATALGGPLAGLAVNALSTSLLGRPDGTTDDVASAVATASPDLLMKIKQAELDFQARLVDAGVKLEEIASSDRDSARRRQENVRDWAPNILAMTVTLGFFGIIGFMSAVDLPSSNRDLLNVMLGALGAAWTSVISYFFGSSAGSLEKTRILGSAVSKE